MKSIVEVDNLSFRYDEQSEYAIKQIGFHVKQGEWLSIIGHNGSGKSTTVRLLDGLLLADSGRILIDGIPVEEGNLERIRQKIGIVFQNPDNQFVGATVEDDVAFGLENQGLSRPQMVERVDEALALVGMSEFKEKEPARLSGGQKQRVAIAGVIAMRPDIIILDEATSMLDPHGRLEVMKIIQKVRQEYGLTVISITHDLDEVSLSDRVLVMKKGQILLDTSPKGLFSQEIDLLAYGLDAPFSKKLQEELQKAGFLPEFGYVTEEELGDKLWQSLSIR
ncbi:energy-coupling factor ABC transporter ATP-binding protein [Streptococcus cuniculipharyngis]|uniref:Energy-coupling factor ABC transporter ATP-binding protein n=1 Tax=Streptococcus cuniculipharyngis TaxID=1562651 RepID=A0A5C5SAK4_9STRE|nr:energy-coupling factor ABC transporter ATP-binding protein [Streptococcus cuniculipharyngis]TWS97728.1 energy-coupling factor ABC transporter ATP-binding protein [Streptococcus cuniculipharyngis]